MAKPNVLRGGGKALKPEIQGLKELEKKLKALLPENPQMQREAQGVVAAAASSMRAAMVESAMNAGWAHHFMSLHWRSKVGKYPNDVRGVDAINSIFSFGKPKPSASGKSKVTALAGVSKSDTMVSWRARKDSNVARRPYRGWTLSPRKKHNREEVAMSLAAALEFGTSKSSAAPAIRPAVKRGQPAIISTVVEQFKAILARVANSNP